MIQRLRLPQDGAGQGARRYRTCPCARFAGEDGLPVLEYPSLARAVYFTTQPNQMVRGGAVMSRIAALVGLRCWR